MSRVIAAFVLFLVVVAGWTVTASLAADTATTTTAQPPPRTLHVVADDNYPPYLFRDVDGAIHGYLVDYWALWSRQTGVPVKLEPMEWAQAQRLFLAGRGDVIDMLYLTQPRTQFYDFSPPYSDLPVNIYHHESISGIHNVATLRGFTVGVMDGDACIDELQRRGITAFQRYRSYTDLIQAAARRDVAVFCLDEVPAQFYFQRLGEYDKFRKGFTLYTGQFHRAVRKGDAATLAEVERGMAAISAEEDARLREKWFGTRLPIASYARVVAIALLGIAAVGAMLLLWNVSLRRRVRRSTEELRTTLTDLQAANRAEQKARQDLEGLREAALAAERDRVFRMLFESSPVPMVHIRNDVFESTNARFRSLFGWNEHELRTFDDWWRLAHPDPQYRALRRRNWEAGLEAARRSGGTLEPRDAEITCADGTQRTILINAQIVGDSVIASLVDVTDLKRAELAMREAKLAAEEASHAKSSFLANMSHEIRTPMNGIIGMAHLMREAGLPAAQEERLAKLEAAADYLLHVLGSVLDLSKIEAGKLVLEERPLDVRQVVGNTVGMIEQKAHAKGLRILIDVADLPHGLVGDAVRLQQTLLNYASNAVKFTERGTITLRARLVSEDVAAAICRFEVEDTGIGIEAPLLQRLFHRFEQADASTTRRYGGTGLGLAITQRLAEQMGGEAGAVSTPGVGSTFWFTARLRKDPSLHVEAGSDRCAAASTALAPADALLARHRGARVLLAEDNEINAEVAGALLKRVGLVVDVARDGAEAVQQALSRDYALILMDMQMPVMDGIAATRRILAECANAPPIVAMTANAFAEDREHCLDAGMRDFIAKPVEPGRLYETLVRWLDAARPGTPA